MPDQGAMPDSCGLWVNLASAGPRRHHDAEPTSYLHFRSTGLVVGLPDEPGVLVEGRAPSSIPLRESDAAGLGLTPEDLALGVAFCSGTEGRAGWRCTPIELLVSDEEGQMHPPGHDEQRGLDGAIAAGGLLTAPPRV